MWMIRCSSIVVCLALLTGCSDGPPAESVTPPSPQTLVKAALDDMMASGSLGGTETLQQQLELMKKTDPAKAEALLKDCEQLPTLSSPQAVKAKAQEMAKKL